MKRLFINIFILFSSFFLISSKEAKTYDVTVDFSLINDDFFNIKEKAEKYKIDNNFDNFIMLFRDNNIVVTFFNNSDLIDNPLICSDFCKILSTGGFYYYNLSSDTFYRNGGMSPFQFRVESLPLYSTYKDVYLNNSTSLRISIGNGYVEVKEEEKYLFLYDLYLKNQKIIYPHLEEEDNLKSFYDLCIEKIGYLATVIVGNYIYLSIFAIFILIFIFSLIKRRYL